MDLEEIRQLILLMKENHVAEIHLERGEEKVKLVAQQAAQAPVIVAAPVAPALIAPPQGQLPAPLLGTAGPHVVEEAEPAVTINSPIVGTFYRAPSPESPSYTEVGDTFDADTVLCIVEAMKVMNEIKAETEGTVLEILVENGQPVEFGQPLFRIQRTA